MKLSVPQSVTVTEPACRHVCFIAVGKARFSLAQMFFCKRNGICSWFGFVKGVSLIGGTNQRHGSNYQ